MSDDSLEHRETLVMKYLTDAKADVDQANNFDDLICEALGIDKNENPPDFIYDALLMGCGQ